MSLSTRLTRQTARHISAAAMAVLAVIFLAPATQAQDISVSIDDESGLVGDTVEVPVSTGQLTSSDDVTSLEFDVGYDTTAVEPIGVVTEGTLSSGLTRVSLSKAPGADNNFRVSGFGSSAITGSGTLVTLQLEVRATGTSQLSFNNFLYNGGSPPSVSAQGGTLTGANTVVSFPDDFQAREPGALQPADTVAVPVTTSELTSGDDVTSLEFDVGYDTTVVEPIGVVTEGTLSSGFTRVSLSKAPGADDNFRVSGFGSSAITGSGTLVTLQLEVLSSGTSRLEFNNFLYNGDGPPAVATTDGTLNAEGPDFTLGDPTENGSVSALDASLTLRADLNLDTLTTAQRAAADVDGDTEVTPNDASLILQFVVGLIDEFPAASGSSASKALASAAQLEWGSVESSEQTRALPVRLEGPVGEVQAVSLTLTGDVEAISFGDVSDRLPQGWQLMHNVYDGGDEAKIVMAGAEPITDAGEIVRLPLSGDAGSIEASGALNGSAQTALGAAPTADRPGSFALQGNFPNPVTQSTAITFDAPQKASVEVEVYDLLGRRVLSTPARAVSAGEGRSIQVDASDLSSGAYIYRLKAETEGGEIGSWTGSGRMVVVK